MDIAVASAPKINGTSPTCYNTESCSEDRLKAQAVVSLLVARVRDYPVIKGDFHSMFVAVVGREPQTAAEKDVYEGWMGLLEVFDKNSDGLVETKELGGLAADVPTYASAEDVNEGRMLLLELLHKNANNGVIKELADFAADVTTKVSAKVHNE